MRFVSLLPALMLASAIAAPIPAVAAIPSPATYFDFTPGSDRQLITYGQLVDYLHELAAASDRIALEEVGLSPLGRPMYALFISSAGNIANLDQLQEINRRLAMDPQIEAAELEELVAEGRVFVMATLSMHSTEVGPSQALPTLAWELATTTDETVLNQLDQVVLLVVPCHNPDGMDMVVDHYLANRGTLYDGSYLPGVYHKYVGHDNNRDFVILSQEDTRVVAALYSSQWFPQVLVEKHQMGSTGPRYFVPTSHDPIAENIDEGLWNWSAVFGANLLKDMTRDGHSGVATHWLFDNYWPGSTETSHWMNVISFLTEAASCRVASPVFVEPTELSVRGKGLSEYKKSTNMPEPWPGGWWGLSDIVAYELSSTRSILRTAARNRTEILHFRNHICRKEVAKGQAEPPYYYVLPTEQHDSGELVRLVELLQRHNVRVDRLASDVVHQGTAFAAGSIVIALAQPYRALIKEIMETQRYPVRHYTPGGKIIRPYDVTSWSLPLHRGLDYVEVETRSEQLESALIEVDSPWRHPASPATLPENLWAVGLPVSDNASFEAAFQAMDSGVQVERLGEDVEVDGRRLATGSFLLVASRNTREKINGIVTALPARPVVLSARPEATSTRLRLPRIALVETYFHDMDAGWTRFVLDTSGVPFTLLRPGELAEADLSGSYDVMVFPDVDAEVLTKGRMKRWGSYVGIDLPPEFRKPVGPDGLANLASFIDGGGVVVAWGGSTGMLLDSLPALGDGGQAPEGDKPETVALPARNMAAELTEKGLYVPGSLLRASVLPDHPVTLGMPPTTSLFSRGAAVYSTTIPKLDMDRRVIVTHPETDILMSGYMEGDTQLKNRAVGVWMKKAAGQIVIFGFNPQFRASTPATYKLLYNSLLLGSDSDRKREKAGS